MPGAAESRDVRRGLSAGDVFSGANGGRRAAKAESEEESVKLLVLVLNKEVF